MFLGPAEAAGHNVTGANGFVGRCSERDDEAIRLQFQQVHFDRQRRNIPISDECRRKLANFLCMQCFDNKASRDWTYRPAWKFCQKGCAGGGAQCFNYRMTLDRPGNAFKLCC